METIIIFTIFYLITLFFYFFSETSNNFKRRAINKIVLASMFLIFAFVMYFKNYEFISYHLVMLIAIIFAYLGDVMLLYNFNIGGASFIISNLLFFVYEWLLIINHHVLFKDVFWFIPIFFITYGFFLSLVKSLHLNKKTASISLYMLSVNLHGTLGIVLARYFNDLSLSLFGIGLFLFMISDYFLMCHKFMCPDKKMVLRANSFFYFTGLLLVVLSMV